MSASDALFALLSQDAEVGAIVGLAASARIYPTAIPVDKDLPAIAYVESAEPITTIHGTVVGEDVTLAIACWATTRTEADALATAVQAALVASGRVWSRRTQGFDEQTGDMSSTVELDWLA